MNLRPNTLQITLLAVLIPALSFCQIKSDNFVNHNGDLVDNTPFTIKNEINNEQELVKKLYYDANGRLVFQRNYDFEGALMYDSDGIAIYEYIYDENGNVLEERYFDEEKAFFQLENIGAAMIKRQFDDLGRMTEVSYFVANDKLIEDGAATIKIEYAADGMTGTERHFDAAGMLVDFCAPIIGLEFNTDGQVIRKVFMNPDGQVCNRFMDGDEDEVSMMEFDYDEIGNVTVQRAYNKAGKLLGTIHS